ncbi:uncharacterized protein LOC144762663 isoform X1 [Lissotriton helveticus]
MAVLKLSSEGRKSFTLGVVPGTPGRGISQRIFRLHAKPSKTRENNFLTRSLRNPWLRYQPFNTQAACKPSKTHENNFLTRSLRNCRLRYQSFNTQKTVLCPRYFKNVQRIYVVYIFLCSLSLALRKVTFTETYVGPTSTGLTSIVWTKLVNSIQTNS